MTQRRPLLLVLLALALFGGAAQAATDPQAAELERRVKAAFVYKFVGFVEWPPSAFEADDPLTFGVIGDDEFAGELRNAIDGRRAHSRPLRVRLVQAGQPLDGLHVLYVGRSESARLPAILQQAAGRPILTVSDVPDGLPRGSVINFLVDDRVRFEIALDAAERASLRLSSRLLSVAFRVRPVAP